MRSQLSPFVNDETAASRRGLAFEGAHFSPDPLNGGSPDADGRSRRSHTAIRAGIERIHFIAPTTSDFHDVNVEGKSGIFATCGRDPRPRWVSSRRRLEWPNGAMCSSRARSRNRCAGRRRKW
jgi:hypothetical protein